MAVFEKVGKFQWKGFGRRVNRTQGYLASTENDKRFAFFDVRREAVTWEFSTKEVKTDGIPFLLGNRLFLRVPEGMLAFNRDTQQIEILKGDFEELVLWNDFGGDGLFINRDNLEFALLREGENTFTHDDKADLWPECIPSFDGKFLALKLIEDREEIDPRYFYVGSWTGNTNSLESVKAIKLDCGHPARKCTKYFINRRGVLLSPRIDGLDKNGIPQV